VLVVKGDKSKAPGLERFLVAHNNNIRDLPIGLEILLELGESDILRQASDKDLVRANRWFSWLLGLV
jgi:hypothetical protein